jgi:hypothetical protein
MGFRFTNDGEVTYVPEEIKSRFKDEVDAIISEAREAAGNSSSSDSDAREEPRDTSSRERSNDSDNRQEERSSPPPPLRIQIEEEEPQTQMAAAFAALKLDQLASDTPPEETKA